MVPAYEAGAPSVMTERLLCKWWVIQTREGVTGLSLPVKEFEGNLEDPILHIAIFSNAPTPYL